MCTLQASLEVLRPTRELSRWRLQGLRCHKIVERSIYAKWTALVGHDVFPTLFIPCCHPGCTEAPKCFREDPEIAKAAAVFFHDGNCQATATVIRHHDYYYNYTCSVQGRRLRPIRQMLCQHAYHDESSCRLYC